ncbi:MAG: chromosome segregation protein SMC [Candidatus Zixiibacteriota bacterium]
MYLKKIELLGFKSFANKTTLQFSEGITAIVGPNGCGKTNILDALRWVLGEQRISLLRGSKMEEVVFGGTRDIKPLGMAEVTLSVVNDRGVLPTEYHELQLTRRLFRSGESEYLLNKVPCRLKDITELFYDTGMGAHSYSVIQQDMIDSVISDRAEERRFLFEEASGITKYKQRKRAALRKLESTENDFLRLNDIYSEVKTQVNSLNRQMKKAQRYEKVAAEITSWDLHLSANRLKEIEMQKRQMRAEQDQQSTLLSEKVATLNKLSSKLESERAEQIDFERLLTDVGQQVYDATEKVHELEKEISLLTEKKSAARDQISRNDLEISATKQRREIIAGELKQVGEQEQKHEAEMNRLLSELASAEAAQAEADERLLKARHRRDKENQHLLALEGRLSSGKTEEANLSDRLSELEKEVAERSDQIDTCNDELKNTAAGLEELRPSLVDLQTKKTDAERHSSELTKRLETLLTESEELGQMQADLSASVEAAQARSNLLGEMILHYEGYESAVIAVMDERERFEGILGTVAEKFRPAAKMEGAIESALGEIGRFIICRDRSSAESVISWVRDESKGRLGILVPSTGGLEAGIKRPEIEIDGFVGWLDQFVSTEPDLRPLMESVLSQTAVFEAGTDPTELLKRLPRGFSAVSTDGILYGNNRLSGGSEDSFPLFGRQERLDQQEQELLELEKNRADISDRKNKTTAAIAAVRAEASETVSLIESLTDKIAPLDQRIVEAEYRQRSLTTDLARLNKERSALTATLEDTQSKQYTLGLDFDQLVDAKTQLIRTLESSQEELDTCEQTATGALAQVSKTRIESVEARSRQEQAQSKSLHLKEVQQELERAAASKLSENETARSEIEKATQRLACLETELKLAFEKRTATTQDQTDLRAKQGEIANQIAAAESQASELRARKDELSEQVHQLEMRESSLDAEITSILERIRSEYELDLRTVEAPRPNEDMSDDQSEALVTELRERLKKFGAVNLLALEEYRAASEREEFLGEQLRDLAAAKKDLQETITKINLTARKMFAETFDKVGENFQKLFTELFSGGEAGISLDNPDDPLESDIHIVARPRGKKALSITMMSGGERALTAIALLFSLYMVKPSPFCILDEIDAPLDDANCRRFLKIIRTFSSQTQFITITHNKITMEAADNLYGVTMEQPGVSQLVGVRFRDLLPDQDSDDSMSPETVDNINQADGAARTLTSEMAVSPHDSSSE